MSCSNSSLVGIKQIALTCGCEREFACAGFETKPVIEKQRLARCGTDASLEFTTGHEIRLESTSPIALLEKSEVSDVTVTVQSVYGASTNGSRFASYENVLMTSLGPSVSSGIWTWEYHGTSIGKPTLTEGLPSPEISISFENCLHNLTSPCEVQALRFGAYNADGDVLGNFYMSQDRTIRSSGGVYYGHADDGFLLPYGDPITIKGTVTIEGTQSEFETVTEANDCPTINLSSSGAASLSVIAISSDSTWVAEVTDASGYNETQFTGDGSLSVSVNSSVTLRGCGINGLEISGDWTILDLGNSCVSEVDISGSSVTDIVGVPEYMTTFIGNAVAAPSCEWPLTSYVDKGRTGIVDLSCWPELLFADISDGDVTGIVASTTVQELVISNNANLTQSSASVSAFTALQTLTAVGTNFASYDFNDSPESLRVLDISDTPINAISGVGAGLEELYMSNTSNTTAQSNLLAGKLPSLKTLHWSYNGIADLWRFLTHPLLEEFYCDSGDPNPLNWSIIDANDTADLRRFTYINSCLASTDVDLVLFGLVRGNINNCVIKIDEGQPAPTGLGCNRIATLQSRGCTVIYTSGGPC